MSVPVWPQLDSGVALALGAILETAALRKLQNPRVFALTLQRLDPALNGRRSLTLRWACFIAGYEAVVGIGIVAFRGGVGFPFACAILIACTAFLVALARAVQQSLPCACFGRLGRTAAGGREIGRAIVLVVGASFLVVQRALDSGRSYGVGPWARGRVARDRRRDRRCATDRRPGPARSRAGLGRPGRPCLHGPIGAHHHRLRQRPLLDQRLRMRASGPCARGGGVCPD